MTVKPSKPFNPILGETFQGFYADGSRIGKLRTFYKYKPILLFDSFGMN